MANQQIVDYIASQVKLGVSLDVTKNALTSAGWAPGDIDEAIKAVQAAPASTKPNVPAASSAKTISVSDLIPSGLDTVQTSFESKLADKAKNAPVVAVKEKIATPVVVAKKKLSMPHISASLIVTIVCAVLALAAGGATVYFYLQVNGLQSKLTAITNTGGTQASQVTSLAAQVAALTSQLADATKAKTDSDANAASLAATNQDLATDLSFFVASNTSGTPTSVSATVKGTLGSGSLYTLILSNGIKLFIANSKTAKVDAALKPLLGTAVEVVGTHNPGSNMLTAQSVNGASVQ